MTTIFLPSKISNENIGLGITRTVTRAMMIPCEAGHADYAHHDPRVVKCGKPATKLIGRGILAAPVCDECYEGMKEKYKSWPVEELR